MRSKEFRLKDNALVTPCPECDNNVSFIAFADPAHVWIECACGFDSGGRLKSLSGSLAFINIMAAAECWNEELR